MEEPQDSRWKKGQSGNPNGRAAGSRNRATLAIEALLEGEGEALTRKAIELAKDGDMQARGSAWTGWHRPAKTAQWPLTCRR